MVVDTTDGSLQSNGSTPIRVIMADQTGRLESSIANRTGGRIHELRVESIDGRVVVRGRTGSHYVKQLALAAVRDSFDAMELQAGRIDLEIEVS